ncbi:LysM peptidoglycan-binding domain-containing protein [Streptomyces sp. SID13666]|uniref:LysM peptidoglycan-binding domain-containing protein n=1 Tax=unclassified Streptomyces TaxID=2593676 RepID=UPI0013C15F12|nr:MULTISPECIES: transglycosylase family protein [unclassified Streptomyces]NEA54336.1 LysM peptidoglycan-binding domain-containing protein [Streptomyces sp. SID13666]NEA75094.1 LysM peptidoglycan-binding domain-containing protein [Streptomyces sp. SID13588]
MLKSGNGRHRRPRQAPTAIVVVAATGAGIALPLLGAGAAQAADATVWDKVAVCESGGMWSANPGNGFYGGLSITEDTWEQYGGTVYAERPDLASRSQQIAVAETLLKELGPDAWPGCSGPAGLVTGGAPPKIDPGSILPPLVTTKPTAPTTTPTTPAAPTTPTTPPASTTPTTPSTPTGTPTTDPTADPSDGTTPATTPTAPSPSSDLADTTPGAAGKTPGKHAKPGSPDSSDGQSADRASRDADRSAGAADGLNGDQNTGQGDVAANGDYVVVPGDNLCDIAADHHLQGGWKALYGANDQIVGDNPDLILPGQHLDLSF